MLDYVSVVVLGVSAIIPIVLDYINISTNYKRALVIICMIALVVSIFFSFKGVSDSQKKDKELDKLTKRNLQIRDSVVVITENTKRLRTKLIETLHLLEEFEGKSLSSSTTIRKRLSRSAEDLKSIIDQSYSLASTSTQTQKLLAQVLDYQHLDSLYSIRRARQDSLEIVKSNYFRTFLTLEMADNKRADSSNWLRLENQIKANSYRDSVRSAGLNSQVNNLKNTLQEQHSQDSIYLKDLDQKIQALQSAYQDLTNTISSNYEKLQNQITNQPDDVGAIKTAIDNMNGNFANQQNRLNQLSGQVSKILQTITQNKSNKTIPPPQNNSSSDTLN